MTESDVTSSRPARSWKANCRTAPTRTPCRVMLTTWGRAVKARDGISRRELSAIYTAHDGGGLCYRDIDYRDIDYIDIGYIIDTYSTHACAWSHVHIYVHLHVYIHSIYIHT